MIRVVLGFLTALLQAAPRLVEIIRDWKIKNDAAKRQQDKDARNDKAIEDATK